MKKLIALLLSLVMLVSVLAACGGGGGLETRGEDEATGGAAATLGAEEWPEDLQLTIGLPTNANVEDYDTNLYTLWLEEQTGFDLVFKQYQSSATDYKAQISTALVGGDKLPDILWNMNLGAGVYEEYGANGYLIDLAPYYNNKELSASFWDRLAELPQDQQEYVIRQLTADDGGMYAFARIEYSLIDTMQYQVYINQTWLDELNLPMPTDIDSLYNTLKAFKTQDPNGNGKADEQPLIGSTKASCGNIVQWIINMYVYCNNGRYFNVDDNNQIYLPHTTDAYRDALKFINKLIKEGLMFNSAWSMTNKEIKALLNPPEGEVMTVGIWSGHPTLTLEVDNSSVNHYVSMPYWGYCVRSEQAFTPATFITADCQYPQAAWHLLMTMCSKEGAYRQRYGNKGETWDGTDTDWVEADAGTKSFIGFDAEIKIKNEAAFGAQGNSTWGSIQGTILIQAENEVCQLTDDMGEWVNAKMKAMGDCYFNYVDGEEKNNPEEKYIYPGVVTPTEISESDSSIRTNCTSLISEATQSFCCGTGTYNDIYNDAQWQSYIDELYNLGLQTWIDNRQPVYEEQFPDRVPG